MISRLQRLSTTSDMPLKVTLTFDNGPTPDVTPVVLESLRLRGLHAYFCVVGRQLRKGQEQIDLARAAIYDGHILVNHSLTHGTALGDDVAPEHARAEILEMHDLMKSLLGDWGAPWFRPFGRGGEIGRHIFSAAALKALASHSYSVLLWNSVPRDWEAPSLWVDKALADVSTREHTVVVLHDLNTGAMAQLPRFLDALDHLGCEITQELPLDCVPVREGVAAWSESALAGLVQD